MQDNSVALTDEMLEKSQTFKNDGCTLIFVAIDKNPVGLIALSDRLREDTRQTIKSIEQIGVSTILLTGDNKHAAKHIASETGITEVYSNCLPEMKLNIIEKYQNEGKPVCMVGDGINDAPALKTAHVGIAMGGIGSDIAIDAADIVLVGDEIKNLPHLLKLSQKTMGKIKFNLTASMVLNFAAIILAMTGLLNPVAGALVHNVGSVVVILNSSLLLNLKNK